MYAKLAILALFAGRIATTNFAPSDNDLVADDEYPYDDAFLPYEFYYDLDDSDIAVDVEYMDDDILSPDQAYYDLLDGSFVERGSESDVTADSLSPQLVVRGERKKGKHHGKKHHGRKQHHGKKQHHQKKKPHHKNKKAHHKSAGHKKPKTKGQHKHHKIGGHHKAHHVNHPKLHVANHAAVKNPFVGRPWGTNHANGWPIGPPKHKDTHVPGGWRSLITPSDLRTAHTIPSAFRSLVTPEVFRTHKHNPPLTTPKPKTPPKTRTVSLGHGHVRTLSHH